MEEDYTGHVPHPSSSELEVKKSDAKERSFRTLKQGLLVTVGIAVATAVLQGLSVMTGNELVSGAAWAVLGVSVVQSGASAALSYINRYTKTPEHTDVHI